MQIDIKTTSIEPLRHTYSHIARRLGQDKPASRHPQEPTLGTVHLGFRTVLNVSFGE